MPGFIPFADDIMESSIEFTASGIPCVITMGWRKIAGGPTNSSDGSNVADNLASWLSASVLPVLTADFVVDSIKVIDLSSTTGWYFIAPEGLTGSAAGTPTPNNVNLVVTLNTDSRGRSFRGRNFWTGLREAALDSPLVWNAGTITEFTDAYITLISDMATAGYAMVVLSRFTAGAPRVLGVATDVTSPQAKFPIATQRGRLT